MISSAVDFIRRLDRSVPRVVWLVAGALFVFNLFYLGAKPFAVGLFHEPWDKVAHFVAFASLAAMLSFGTRNRWPLLVLLVAVSVGAADEIHQIWLPGRMADVKDFVADCCGVFSVHSLLAIERIRFFNLRKRFRASD